MQLITLLDMNPLHDLLRNPSGFDPFSGTFRRGEEDTVHFVSTSSHSSLIVVIPLFIFFLLLFMFALLWSFFKPNPRKIGYKSVLIVRFIHPLAKSFMDLGFEVNGREEIKEIGKRRNKRDREEVMRYCRAREKRAQNSDR